jgi:uncharacterized protein YjdB
VFYARIDKIKVFNNREGFLGRFNRAEVNRNIMNLLRRFVDVFRIDSIDMNALTGNVGSTANRSVDLSLVVGATETLKATVAPDDTTDRPRRERTLH